MTTQTLPKNWTRSAVAKAATVIMGQSPDSRFVNEEQIGYPFLQGNAEFNEKHPIPVHWVTKPTKLSEKGDILISVRAPVGEINIADDVYCIGRGLAAIRFKKIKKQFGWYAIAYHKDQLGKLAQGSTFTAVSSKDFSSFEIIHPNDPAEQRAIADILSTADEAIAQSESLVRKYQSIKQGLMSDLLTRGVDENGELRPTREEAPELYRESPLGWLPKEWEITEIQERCSVEVGGTPSTFMPEYWNHGDIPWMSSGDVHMRKIFDVPGRITSKGLAASNAKLIRPPAIALALAGQGRTRGMVALTHIELCTNQSVALIKPANDELITTFLFYDLEFRYDELRSISMGAGRAGLSKQIINKIAIPIPSFAEQRIIAHIFETQDDVIEVENRKLEKLKLLKQGLMQDLLSGQVRVKV